ncbi:MAG: tRNA 2-selenouridine(34) synthase MnmH [Bacteroidales bacterium]|nr:MAG: tRNA 2-selenouridine(34) synthase MnmH [Bacteroidales bacterium]
MIQKISIREFLEKAENLPLIDVRSPSEYIHGHIPGAVNIPLFDDHERAILGTLYKQKNRDTAIMKGLEIAGPKMTSLVKQAKRIMTGNSLLMHCWRGGLRSESMGWLFQTSGLTCLILNGGYKSYRHYIREQFAEVKDFLILGGLTGSGKTSILKELSKLGQQTIDLEEIAHHKGSAFGSLAETDQPTNEQFENNLFEKWKRFNPARPVWLEDESMAIGSVFIPDEIFKQMRNSHVISVDMDLMIRIKRLEKEYASFPASLLKDSIGKIHKRLGNEKYRVATEAVDQKDFQTAIRIILHYYDKTYLFGLNRRNPGKIHKIKLQTDDPAKNAKIILDHARMMILSDGLSI